MKKTIWNWSGANARFGTLHAGLFYGMKLEIRQTSTYLAKSKYAESLISSRINKGL